jgi:TetR/AcrR family transcriptional regulator, fatty acid metabolism regulator protein
MMASVDQRERRREILRAAIRVFARKGYHTCRVGDVAAEAGVAYGLVYHYFPSKESLLETIFERTWQNMLDAVREVEESEAPAAEQLRMVAHIVLQGWVADPDLIRVLVREVTRSPHLQEEVEEIAHAFAALERIVARGQERGELRADIGGRLAAWIFYGALEEILTGWVFGRLPDGEADVAAAENAVVAVLLDGVRAAK